MAFTDVLRKVSSRGAKCSVVIVAAGSAKRMKGVDKIMAELGGEPLLLHTVRAFEAIDEVTEIIVVTRDELREQLSELFVRSRLQKIKTICKGGETRAESVQNGLDQVSKKCGLVAIHDGARPLVSEKVIHDAIRKAAKFGAAAPAIPVKDTIKQVGGGVVESTPDRSKLYAVQTPQVFDVQTYRAALERAIGSKEQYTDDCSVAEAYGMNIIITEGSEENIKVTTPTDLVLAEALWQARQPK